MITFKTITGFSRYRVSYSICREWRAVKDKELKDPDRIIKEEINRKYAGSEEIGFDAELAKRQKYRRTVLGVVALIVAFAFLFAVTGRQLYYFFGPSMQFLRESWALADDPLVIELRDSVVQVYIEPVAGASRQQLRGSGFNLAQEGLIATNRHLVENALSVRVSFPGRGTFSAESWVVSPYTDLALVILDTEELPYVDISSQPAMPGEEVLIIGNPLQFARVANRGEVLGYREARGREIPVLVIEALIYPGSSGSPVFNDQGEVVGIIYATLRGSAPDEIRGLAISAAELQLFLNEFR